MISLGRINLFYSRDETMKFLCFPPNSPASQPPTADVFSRFFVLFVWLGGDKGRSCEENWFEINARICYRKNKQARVWIDRVLENKSC